MYRLRARERRSRERRRPFGPPPFSWTFFLNCLFTSLERKHKLDIPREIKNHVIGLALEPEPPLDEMEPLFNFNPATIPPSNNLSPFMRLSTELRRKILAESLPVLDRVYPPLCEDEPRPNPMPPKTEPGQQPRRNRISDLMTLNHTIRDEVAEVVYEERTFVIHVHSLIRNGGIEFLDAGRQPLQYKDLVEDPRFDRFGLDDEFGFHRLTKISIVIYYATKESERHAAVNTYFMNLALCQLLERHREKSRRIKSIQVRFAKHPDPICEREFAADQHKDQYWWDSDKEKPRETSIHNLSNIELVLRPFAHLTGCHNVDIELPAMVCVHGPTVAFVGALKHSMMNTNGPTFSNDAFRVRIESARAALEEFVMYTVYGTRYHYVPPLTEAELAEDADAMIDVVDEKGKKRALSANSRDSKGFKRHRSSGSTAKDPIAMDEDSHVDNHDDDEARALQASHDTLQEDEDRMMAAAIQASLINDSGPSTGNGASSTRLPIRSKIQVRPTPQASTKSALPASGKLLPNRGKCSTPGSAQTNVVAVGAITPAENAFHWQLPNRSRRTAGVSWRRFPVNHPEDLESEMRGQITGTNEQTARVDEVIASEE